VESKLRATTFHETMKNIFEYRNWNSTKFENKTGLAKINYTRAMKENHNPTIRTIITICVALDINMMMTNYLLELKGFKLTMNDKVHRAYAYLIENFKGSDIEDCNIILAKMGVEEKNFLVLNQLNSYFYSKQAMS